MPQKPEDVLRDLKSGKYAPIYFLQGEEPFYIDQILGYIEKNAIDDSMKGFNQVVLYGKDVDMGTVISNARRFPMMGDRQVVIVKEAQEIKDLTKADAVKLMEAYLQNPLPSTILVFGHKYKKVDGRSSLGKSFDKHGILVTSEKMYENKLPAWILDYVKEKGFTIHDKAVQMLADNIGNNLERLANEIDKVLINFKEKGQIDPATIQKYVGISKDYNVFELQKALAVRDILKVNQIVHYFEANPKSNPIIPIIASLFGYFTKLMLIHHSKDKSEAHLASAIGVHPFVLKEYLQASRNYSLPKVIDNIHYIRQADMQSKGIDSGAMSEGEILKELTFKIMH